MTGGVYCPIKSDNDMHKAVGTAHPTDTIVAVGGRDESRPYVSMLTRVCRGSSLAGVLGVSPKSLKSPNAWGI
jgi:hypothetical protein